MARVKIQITTPSNNVIKVSPGVSALSSVQLYLNELIDVNTQHGADGYVLTQQADGTFAMEAVATTLADLSDTNIPNPQGGESLVYDANTQKWVPGGVKSVNGQDGDVVITIPSPPPTPGVSGLADTNITNLQDDQIIRYDSASGNWLNEDLEALPAGGTTGQALVKASNTDYDVTWDDIAVDVQFHQRYATEAETLRSGATETVELYFFAQGDGNGLAESASSDTPTSGYDIRRKLWYAEKAQAAPDTSADWTQFTAIADNTTFNNAKAALLAYLKERTGGTVPISLKMTWEEVAQAPSFTGLLNESYGSGAEAAYSTRRLNGNVTDCMVIRRASDSTTQTIGFDGSGNIDESAITTFCTGTTCTVVTWKDQSGNGNDATAQSGNEPTIYTGGALVKENGKVALEFDGSNDYLVVSSTQWTDGQMMSSLVLTGTGGAATYWADGNNTTFRFWNDGTNHKLIAWPLTPIVISKGSDMSTGQLLVVGRVGTSSEGYTLYENGSSVANTATYTGSMPTTSTDAYIGQNNNGTQRYQGKMQELVHWSTNKSSVRTSIESNIGDYFTQNTPLLDTYSGAAACYSLRLMRSAYTGSAVEVYNGSSYADIGFNVFGELDTVALAAHCGSNNGFVSKWYDQSGNANHATQTTTANMPKIYDGTTGVVTENGKATIEFEGGTQAITIKLGSGNTAHFFTTMKYTQDLNSYLFNYAGSPFRLRMVSSGSGYTGQHITPNGTITNSEISFTSQLLHSALISPTVFDSYSNGQGSSSATANTVSLATSMELPRVGNTRVRMKVQEMIIYNSDQSSNRTNIEDNINTFYSIY